jgi:hypothetical protein
LALSARQIRWFDRPGPARNTLARDPAPDDWTVTPAFLWQRTAASDTNIFYPDIGLYDQDKRVAEPSADYLVLPSLTVTKTFGWADLTSVSSYFQRDFRRVTDGTLYNSNIFANSYVVAGAYTTPPTPVPTAQQIYQTQTVLGFLPSPANYDARTEQISQELRLSSKSASIAGIATTWTAGLYYSDQHRRFLDDEIIPGMQATFQQIYGYPINSAASVVGPTYYAATPAYPGVSYANDLIYYGHTYPIQKQIAPFGELGFEIMPALKGAIGLRYVSAKSSEVVDSGGFYAYGLPAVYAINWSDIQQTINLPTCGYLFTTNVGDAKIYGSEFELRALVMPSLTLSLNAGTTHAYISSVSTEGEGIVNVGESILGVPMYTINARIGQYRAAGRAAMVWHALGCAARRRPAVLRWAPAPRIIEDNPRFPRSRRRRRPWCAARRPARYVGRPAGRRRNVG